MRKSISIAIIPVALVFVTFAFGGVKQKRVQKKQVKEAKIASESCVTESLGDSGIGDVRFSILSETDFQNVHGSEWVQLKGQALANLDYGNYSGETIAQQMKDAPSYVSSTHLPDASGRFLRSKNMPGAPKGNPESDDVLIGAARGFSTGLSTENSVVIKELEPGLYHTHKLVAAATHPGGNSHVTLSPSNHIAVIGELSYDESYALDGGGAAPNIGNTGWQGQHAHTVDGGGDAESRPQNVTVNAYVRIKRSCAPKHLLDTLGAARCKPVDEVTYPDGCFVLPDSNTSERQAKVACLKQAFEDWENASEEQRFWVDACEVQVISKSKELLSLIGAERTAGEETWFNEINTEFPHYYVVNSKPKK